ncbi:unnamed protein product, partial [Rotaria sordida]
EKKLRTILPSTMNLDELRDIAILMHKIMSIDIVQSLWIVYRKYGVEKIQSKRPINESDTKIWPKEVSSLMGQLKNDNIIDESSCLVFVNQCLQELYNKKENYRRELNVKTSRLSGYNRSIEYTIEKFVQQVLQSLHIEINEHIATVQYHYTDIIFQQTYFAQNPNANQIQLMKHICKLKYSQEMTKCEVKLLKEKISLHLISHRFEHESIIKLSWIKSIRESRTRQELYKQYKNVAEQARSNMMIAYMECAEGQKQQYQKHYDVAMKELHDIQKMHPSNQQLTETMWNLIQKR